MDALDATIKLPSTPIKQFQIECNAPLNAIVTRVEREPSYAGGSLNNSAMSVDENGSPAKAAPEAGAAAGALPDRIFSPLPRAHETAVHERERTLARIQQKQAKLQDFLVQTKSRVTASEGASKQVAEAAARDAQEKARRRIDQSEKLIPKPSAGAPRRPAEVGEGTRPWGKGGRRGRGGGGAGAKSARDVAAELGHDVSSSLSDTMMARRGLLSHKHGASAEVSVSVGSTPTKPPHPLASAGGAGASPKRDAEDAIKDLGSTLLEAGRADAWEGDARIEMRERKAREVVYGEVRRSMMAGERLRVRELRREREEEGAREKREAEARRRREEEQRISVEAEGRIEDLRQQNVLKNLAMRLAAEKDVEERLRRPKQQQVESLRYSEALRHRLLDGISERGGVVAALCPCVPPRSVADNRVHLCASNCPLKNNWKTYNRLVSDSKQMLGVHE